MKFNRYFITCLVVFSCFASMAQNQTTQTLNSYEMKFINQASQMVSLTQPRFSVLGKYIGNPELTQEYRNQIGVVGQTIGEGWNRISVPVFSGQCEKLSTYMISAQSIFLADPETQSIQNLFKANSYLNGVIQELDRLAPGLCTSRPITIIALPENVPNPETVQEYLLYVQRGTSIIVDKLDIYNIRAERWVKKYSNRKVTKELNDTFRASGLDEHQVRPQSITSESQEMVMILNEIYVILNKLRVMKCPDKTNVFAANFQRLCYDAQESLAIMARAVVSENEEDIVISYQKMKHASERFAQSVRVD